MITEYNIQEMFKQAFGTKPYTVPAFTDKTNSTGFDLPGTKETVITTAAGSTLLAQYNGVEILLPVWFRELPAGIGENGTLFMPYTVVKIQGKKTIIKTPLSERTGTVKEQFNIDDYQINIKGFLIDNKRVWPEKELQDLKQLYELNQAIVLDNALTNVFLGKKQETGVVEKVVIESFDCPEVEGGRSHVRPFTMSLVSDNIFSLEIDA